jgi:hypothetical protein
VIDSVLKQLREIGAAAGLKGFEQIQTLMLSDEPFTVQNELLTVTTKICSK